MRWEELGMEDFFKEFIHIASNFEDYLSLVVNRYGIYTYILLFLMIFLEAASIITSFLPGDSLIFIVGTLASIKLLNLPIILVILWAAIIVGDAINYYIGKLLGKKIMNKGDKWFFKKESIGKARTFYENHGKMAIIMGRFIPIVRSFIAFVAGLSSMKFYKFLVYAAIGSFLRICLFLFGGYYFGRIDIVKNNLDKAVMIVAAITMLPAIAGIIKSKQKNQR